MKKLHRLMWMVIGVLAVAVAMETFFLYSDNSANSPKLTLVGGSTCNEKTRATFSYQLTGFTPNSVAQVNVYYPNGDVYPYVAGSPGLGAGTVQLDAHGSFTSHGWQCWFSSKPGTAPDPTGTYRIQAIDKTSNHATAELSFTDTATPTG